MTRHFSLTPQDAWFFRDGRPYNHKESNQADVESVFPPPARTLTGAIRAALARANGWRGRGRWTEALNRDLGAGPNDLGKLQFTGPFLLRCGEALWPLPSHILGKQDKGGPWKPNALLRPSASLLETDQGRINLPEIATGAGETAGLKSGSGWWITAAGLGEVLAGKLPSASAVVAPGVLWGTEARVGFRRDEQTLQVGEGDLYSPSCIRLARNTALGLGLEGLPSEMEGPPGLFPLGGESRLARCESLTTAPLPKAPSSDRVTPNAHGRVEFTVILLTPGGFRDLELSLPGARVVSACLGKPVYLGGWDSLANEPLPLEPFHPAGSVWFCDAPVEGFRTGVLIQHGRWIGEHSRHGYGQIAIGRWPAPSNSDSDHKP